MRRMSSMVLMSGAAALLWAGLAMAQDAAAEQEVTPIPLGIASPATGAETPPAPETEAVAPATPGIEGVNPNDMPSLLFTYWEHTAIVDMKRSQGDERGVTEQELMQDLNR